MAIAQDFWEGWANEPFTIEVCLTDCDGNPLDLTGAVVEWKVVDYYGGTTILSVDTNSGSGYIFITDSLNGIVEINLPESETLNIANVQECTNFSMKVTFPSADVEILFHGWQLYFYRR